MEGQHQLKGVGLVAMGWLVVVVAGMFVPLMDNDSAHHANIALRMYLTGDYVRLVDYDGPYLDKPHLHFWLSALSYHLFGVTGFAYKFPTLVFSIVGVWGVYRAGVLLKNEAVGRLAALVFGSSVSLLLSLNDVRMDGILTAAVAISVWQMAGFIKHRSIKYMLGVALGLAIGFCTKGHIGVFMPGLFFIFYCLLNRSWSILLDVRILIGVFVFLVLISPVVYCYYLQYNLHPGVVVRGKDHIDGVRFILWDQTLGRYGGEMGAGAKGDRFFFLHTFFWVFAPWSLIGFVSLWINRGVKRTEPLSNVIVGVLVVFGALVGFSSFKLPHYLNVILPLASIWIADIVSKEDGKIIKTLIRLEWLLWALLGVFIQFVLIWWFPEQPIYFWMGLVIYLALLFYIARNNGINNSMGLVTRIVSAMLLLFWILNSGFYSSLLKYQGGNMLAKRESVNKILAPIYSWKGFYSSSFYFYTKTLRRELSPEEVKRGNEYILLDEKQLSELAVAGVRWERVDSVIDYEITRLTGRFLDRSRRESVCTRLVLVRIMGPGI